MDDNFFRNVIDIITANSIKFIEENLKINALSKKIYLRDVPKVNLNYLTSIISIKGQLTSVIVFSYEKNIIDKLFAQFTSDIEIGDNEKDELYAESACEIMNIIIGNSTKSLEDATNILYLSPPIILNEGKSIFNRKDSKYYHSIISTEYGNINIYLIIQNESKE
ncbi:MAG: chemotaxis protein CheX [Thermodesulfovibrionales bacterium]|nr:chemotaxis protein CheX [Thermodesulfovibrionales bacterium]